jgi:mRNA-degrading endonuclease toxin of MazEF toxin-antitoxin module
VRRGEVYLVDLVPRSGSEQQGRRPAVLVSRDSLVLCHRPTTLDRGTFIDRIGALTVDRVAAIDAGLAAASGLPSSAG